MVPRRGLVFCFLTAAATIAHSRDVFSKDALLSIIDAHNYDNTADFLNSPDIPQTYLQHFRPLKAATRVQPATFEQPRIIAYGDDDSTFIYTINGGLPGSLDVHARNESIEMLQQTKLGSGTVNEYYSLHFNPGGNPRYEISKANPVQCVHCHMDAEPMSQADARVMSESEIAEFRETVLARKGKISADALRRYLSFDWEHRATDHLLQVLKKF